MSRPLGRVPGRRHRNRHVPVDGQVCQRFDGAVRPPDLQFLDPRRLPEPEVEPGVVLRQVRLSPLVDAHLRSSPRGQAHDGAHGLRAVLPLLEADAQPVVPVRGDVPEKRPTLLVGDGRGRFTDAADDGGPYFLTKRSGRGAAFGDFDDDGRIDIVVSHVDLKATPALLRNVTSNGNHWLGVSLRRGRNRAEPVGAVVRLTAGGKTQVRVYQRAQSYLSQNDPRLHFGLGKATRVEKLEVRWPSGAVETLTSLPVDRYMSVTGGGG